ncbi:putative chromatin regulator PHD family [Arabidopsis thaliana]
MKLPFTCHACGLCSAEYPCLCLQCCFIIHRACIFLPRVIKINRHDHRISHVSSLGPGKWICRVCYEHVNGEYGAYSCFVCSYVFHSKCATTCLTIWDRRELEGVPEEDEKDESKPFIVIDQNLIKHFSHEHNLKSSLSSSRLEEPREHCYACTLPFYAELCYKCTQCDFIHDACANLPLKKRHQISLQILTLCDKEYPCLCLQCCFMIHRACIFLPRVIYINRHDHRISHVSSLSPGKWICRVCYEHVNEDYGAYACSICSYFFHSKCATNTNIWDGRELEGVPEEDEKEEIKPFEVIDQTLIKHFSHEHNLKASISSSRLEEPRERCCACTLPFYSEMCYKCTQCDFILHDSCANLPLKKRHEISTHKLMLCTKSQLGANFENSFFCVTCQRYCTGFSYNITGDENNTQHSIDVRCASISDAFKHESHPHWLFVFFDLFYSRCEGCDLNCWFYLRCKDKDDCGGYNLCFTCATLPTLVRDKYDDHPLSLCYGEKNVNARYCCGICEEDVHSKSWFYKCNECGSTLHTKCVFQNLIHSRSGYSLVIGNKGSFDLLPNNRLSRPICYLCKIRCMGDFVLHKKADTSIFICCSCGFNYKDLVRRY